MIEYLQTKEVVMPQVAPMPVAGPTILVVGFDADVGLITRYAGKARFLGYDQVIRPIDMPSGIGLVIYHNAEAINDAHKKRIINLSLAVNANSEPSNSLVTMRHRLEELFPDPVVHKAEPVDSILANSKIREVQARPGSLREFLRDNIIYPCSPRDEARRLFRLAQEKKLTDSEDSVYQAVLVVLNLAGLRQPNFKHPAPETPSEMPAEVAATTASEVMTGVQKIIEGLTTGNNLAISALRTIQLKVQGLEAKAAGSERFRLENETLRKQVETMRRNAHEAEMTLQDIRKRLKID